MKGKQPVRLINLLLGISLTFNAATSAFGELEENTSPDTGLAPFIEEEIEPETSSTIWEEEGYIYIFVPSWAETGVKYEYDGPPARLRLINYSPEGLTNHLPYLSDGYVWSTWTTGTWFTGGAVYVLIDKEPTWGGPFSFVTNSDYFFPRYDTAVWPGDFTGPPGYGDEKTVADLSRGNYWDFDLNTGQYIRLIVQDSKGHFYDNRGGVTFRIPVKKNHIYLDPGHGKDPITREYRRGCSIYGDYEDDLDLKIATELYSKFPEEYKVDMTRFSEFDLVSSERDSWERRVKMANDRYDRLVEKIGDEEEVRKRMVFISIHCNADGPTAHGTEAFYSWENPEPARSLTLASSALDELVKINLKNRDVRIKDWYVIAKTKMPACLVEVAFFTNLEPDLDQTWLDIEALRLHQPEFRESAAEAIKNGTINYFKFWEE